MRSLIHSRSIIRIFPTKVPILAAVRTWFEPGCDHNVIGNEFDVLLVEIVSCFSGILKSLIGRQAGVPPRDLPLIYAANLKDRFLLSHAVGRIRLSRLIRRQP